MLETTPSHLVPNENYIDSNSVSSDDRIQITNVTTYPYCAIVQVKAYYYDAGVSISGTGAMVGEKAVLTAGHIIYDQKYGWASFVEVVPGGTGSGYDTFNSVTLLRPAIFLL